MGGGFDEDDLVFDEFLDVVDLEGDCVSFVSFLHFCDPLESVEGVAPETAAIVIVVFVAPPIVLVAPSIVLVAPAVVVVLFVSPSVIVVIVVVIITPSVVIFVSPPVVVSIVILTPSPLVVTPPTPAELVEDLSSSSTEAFTSLLNLCERID